MTRLPSIADVPWLDVKAARREDGDVVLFCVNRSLTRDYRAIINLQGFRPANAVMAKTITAPSIYDRNDEDDPDGVGVTTTHPALDKPNEYTFPPASVVVLQFRLQTH